MILDANGDPGLDHGRYLISSLQHKIYTTPSVFMRANYLSTYISATIEPN